MSRESRVLILRPALRAIRWRAAASATVFVVAVVAILAATVGPIYLHAVDETVLATHLKDTSLFQRDVLVSVDSLPGYPGVDWDAQVRGLAGEVAHDHLFARPVSEQQVNVIYGGAQPLKSEIASVEDLCFHLRIVRGHCLSGNSTDETLITANTAAAEHLTLGGTLATTAPNGVPIRLRVVGVYRPVAPGGSFWEPWDLFQFGQPGSLDALPPGGASFVTSAALSSRLQRVPQTLSANVALLPGDVGYDDIGELRTTIAHVNATVAHLSYRRDQGKIGVRFRPSPPLARVGAVGDRAMADGGHAAGLVIFCQLVEDAIPARATSGGRTGDCATPIRCTASIKGQSRSRRCCRARDTNTPRAAPAVLGRVRRPPSAVPLHA